MINIYRYIINGRERTGVLIAREIFFGTILSASTLSLVFISRSLCFFFRRLGDPEYV